MSSRQFSVLLQHRNDRGNSSREVGDHGPSRQLGLYRAVLRPGDQVQRSPQIRNSTRAGVGTCLWSTRNPPLAMRVQSHRRNSRAEFTARVCAILVICRRNPLLPEPVAADLRASGGCQLKGLDDVPHPVWNSGIADALSRLGGSIWPRNSILRRTTNMPPTPARLPQPTTIPARDWKPA